MAQISFFVVPTNSPNFSGFFQSNVEFIYLGYSPNKSISSKSKQSDNFEGGKTIIGP